MVFARANEHMRFFILISLCFHFDFCLKYHDDMALLGIATNSLLKKHRYNTEGEYLTQTISVSNSSLDVHVKKLESSTTPETNFSP